MPQMFPLLWLILFLSSALALSFSMSTLYFSAQSKPTSLKFSYPQNFHNWKW